MEFDDASVDVEMFRGEGERELGSSLGSPWGVSRGAKTGGDNMLGGGGQAFNKSTT